jgi:hypothetical protein
LVLHLRRWEENVDRPPPPIALHGTFCRNLFLHYSLFVLDLVKWTRLN